MASKSFVFSFGDIEVREREFTLIKVGETISVEPKAFRVLLILLRNPGKLISKEELLNAVWGDAAVTENSLTRSIALLRRLLGDDTHNPRYIETVATVGYRLVCTVESVEDPVGVATAPDPVTAPRSRETVNGENTLTLGPDGVTRKARGGKWVLAVGSGALALLAVGVWYQRRPLPPPRITTYTQITHDGRAKYLAGTDGSRLYFFQLSPRILAEVGVHGGEISVLHFPFPGDQLLYDVSPDGSNALVACFEQDRNALSQWVAPMFGGAATRLEGVGGMGAGKYGPGTAPTGAGRFSPGGDSVIYSTLSGDIVTVRIDGTGRKRLASVGTGAGGFQWSPDGKSIRFDKDGLLWEMSSDGTGIHRLLPDWKEQGLQLSGRWTPDGSFYLFMLLTSNKGEIWALDERHELLRAGTLTPIQLTNGPLSWGPPIPSKDGTKIFATARNLHGELSRIDSKASSLQPFLGGISAEFVSFSPDGNYVAYVAFPEGTLWKANRDGGNRMQLTQSPDYVVNPRWSPDSKELLFTISSPVGHDSIHRISAAEGTPLWLMSEESANMHDANWSPDGKKVLYGLGRGPTTEKKGLRIVDLDTRQVTILSGSDGMWSPRWSPDGRYIAARPWPMMASLQIFDLQLKRWFVLKLNGRVDFPTFSHDSKFIYFLRYGLDQGVFRISVTGGKEERLVDMSNWHLTGFFGYSLSLDATDAPLVLRDTGGNDIYALTLEAK